ncbi:hypothetical protein AB6A40_006542 [Gnathostoma spinigerum]|uniref:Uncharacterized protein n=1 Tax=Gnathostoma spinigerum TaxID=75299 RepID=A0ABD6EIV7_9BILA
MLSKFQCNDDSVRRKKKSQQILQYMLLNDTTNNRIGQTTLEKSPQIEGNLRKPKSSNWQQNPLYKMQHSTPKVEFKDAVCDLLNSMKAFTVEAQISESVAKSLHNCEMELARLSLNLTSSELQPEKVQHKE